MLAEALVHRDAKGERKLALDVDIAVEIRFEKAT